MTESEAVEFLRAKGYHVSPPPCAECKGAGYVSESDGGGSGAFRWGGISQRPCSRGCMIVIYNDTPPLGSLPQQTHARPIRYSIPRLGIWETDESYTRRCEEFEAC